MIKHDIEAYKLLHDGVLAFSRAEQQGLRIDMDYINKQNTIIAKQITDLESEFYDSEFYRDWQKSEHSKKINIYSPVQLGKYLYKVRKIKPPKETATGSGSTDEETLKRLGLPELSAYLKIKKLKKLKDTYIASLAREQHDGWIHPFINLHTVKSYRSSVNSPNFQNLPNRDEESMNLIRGAIFPRKGHQLLELDFSQLEVSISACYNKDDQLIHDILEGDMHKDMACQIFKIKKFDNENSDHKTLRRATKNGFVFPEFYGDYYKNCADRLASIWGELPKTRWKEGQGIKFNDKHLSDHLIANGIKSFNAFERHIEKIEDVFWNDRYFKYAKWKENWWKKYQLKGYAKSKTGFVFQGVMRRNDVINYPIQASAFHCLLWSFIQATQAQVRDRWKTRLVGQIHDSIILDVYPGELDKVIKIMKCIMCNDVRQHWKWIIVPLKVKAELCPVDGSWSQKKDYAI
jgi:DNA polymerase I